jgi:diguanylate cyclase (GGDEF)-like protein
MGLAAIRANCRVSGHPTRLLRLWRLENSRVAAAAVKINLARMLFLCPIVALLNAAHVVVFYYAWSHSAPDDATIRWKWGLVVAHALMGVAMFVATALASRWRDDPGRTRAQVLPVVVITLTMGFAVAIVSIDQWVTPNITPFLITCLMTSLVVYLRPTTAFVMYLGAYFGYFWAIGLTQGNPTILLSNRVNGIAACGMGLALTILLWRKFTIITQQQRQLEKANATLQLNQVSLERLTRIDGLTGLFNRSTFAEMARRELDRAQRVGGHTAILLLDLDHFKQINDTWGHPAGDAVLQHTAQVIASSVRSTDLVGRLGGEEFMVLLPDTAPPDARSLAEKIRIRLADTASPWQGALITITVSIGIGRTSAAENRSFEALYQEADKALYLAKQGGRNRVVDNPLDLTTRGLA